jgi:hypothetical protein
VRRIPFWITGIIAILTVILLVVGIHEYQETGWLPIALGVFWALWVLGTAPKLFSRD